MKHKDESIRKKVVIIGDCHCGKTSLCYSFTKNQFINEHQPTIIDTLVKTIDIENNQVTKIISINFLDYYFNFSRFFL